jgi:hypothetical protein
VALLEAMATGLPAVVGGGFDPGGRGPQETASSCSAIVPAGRSRICSKSGSTSQDGAAGC